MATIFIVDDSPTARMAVREALADCGHVLREFPDGDDALAAAQHSAPDLAIVDVVMERTNGFRLCRELRGSATTCRTLVVLLTARAAESDARWGFSQGADAFLAKPFEAAVLRETVDRLLAEARA